MTCGVYSIKSEMTQRVYVGSSGCIERRWGSHRRSLRRGAHENGYLQRAWIKYGESDFKFKILEETTEQDLVTREQYWIDYYSSADPKRGFNLLPFARSGRGIKRSAEVIENVRRGAYKRYEDPKQRELTSQGAKVWATSEEMARRNNKYWKNAPDEVRDKKRNQAKEQWGPGGSLRIAHDGRKD